MTKDLKWVFITMILSLSNFAHANPILGGKSFGQNDINASNELIIKSQFQPPQEKLTSEDVAHWIPIEYNSLNHPIIFRTQMIEKTGNPTMPTQSDGNFIRDGIHGKDQVSILETTDNEALIRSRILARAGVGLVKTKTVQKIIRTQKKSILMRAVTGLRFNSRSKVAGPQTNSDESQPFNVTEKTIDHRFRFDLQALRGKASLSYSGLVNSRLEYRIGDEVLRFSIEERLSETSLFALTHQKDRFEERQLLMYQISW